MPCSSEPSSRSTVRPSEFSSSCAPRAIEPSKCSLVRTTVPSSCSDVWTAFQARQVVSRALDDLGELHLLLRQLLDQRRHFAAHRLQRLGHACRWC